ncbi:uncharacterized protein AMSG_04934 [Thecamonas trahens ATCC 50062]|uniref:Uncharacterized protein n=1 Tax=Thecamonas trahens ATCC 50062 TaxID=461836 RepID=A0A0L0D8S9_THETB|nr:hypothetical protein AMSG_04934 [Thecamonas trahens ATCC 50062]KNC48486.1 hypothetical protein AMSG_04934 [Thecamonas trahens ATCC 50062]|eukprot:XP_013758598.1 hypothetical protein AMSG_04934 [Thecamonas trahens ATCC 50062]
MGFTPWSSTWLRVVLVVLAVLVCLQLALAPSSAPATSHESAELLARATDGTHSGSDSRDSSSGGESKSSGQSNWRDGSDAERKKQLARQQEWARWSKAGSRPLPETLKNGADAAVTSVPQSHIEFAVDFTPSDWFAFVRIQKTATKTFTAVLRAAVTHAFGLQPMQCRQSFCVTKTRDLPTNCTHFRNCVEAIAPLTSYSHVMRCRLLVEPHADYADLLRPFVAHRRGVPYRRPACILPEVYPMPDSEVVGYSVMLNASMALSPIVPPPPLRPKGQGKRALLSMARPANSAWGESLDKFAVKAQMDQADAMNRVLAGPPLHTNLREAYLRAAQEKVEEGTEPGAPRNITRARELAEERAWRVWTIRQCRSLLLATMLRHPLDRVISEYKFNAGQDCIWDSGLIAPGAPTRDGCAAYVTEPANAVGASNRMTSMLAGHSDAHPHEVYPSPDAMLEMAWKHVASMAFVGIAERFNDSLVLLSCRVGIDAHNLGVAFASHSLVANKTDGMRLFDVDDELAALVLAHNALDLQLYTRALALFERQLAHCLATRPDVVADFRAGMAAPSMRHVELPDDGWDAGLASEYGAAPTPHPGDNLEPGEV